MTLSFIDPLRFVAGQTNQLSMASNKIYAFSHCDNSPGPSSFPWATDFSTSSSVGIFLYTATRIVGTIPDAGSSLASALLTIR
jgi:hypothetical protein